MEESKVSIQIKVVAEYEGRSFESVIDANNGIRINSFRCINSEDIHDAMKRYILNNCDDVTILEALVQSEEDLRMLAYNQNLSHELADELVKTMYEKGMNGIYPNEFWVMLKNPCVSGQMLDSIAHKLVQKYKKAQKAEGTNSFEFVYLLVNIACNIAVWESTLEFLKSSEIPKVVEAAKR